MNRVHCTNCGRDGHPKWQCPYPPKESEKTSEPRVAKTATSVGQIPPVTSTDDGGLNRKGTPDRSGSVSSAQADVRKGTSSVDSLSVTEKVHSSTLAKFDKKAWMREYMRDHRKGILRRARKKASAEGRDE